MLLRELRSSKAPADSFPLWIGLAWSLIGGIRFSWFAGWWSFSPGRTPCDAGTAFWESVTNGRAMPNEPAVLHAASFQLLLPTQHPGFGALGFGLWNHAFLLIQH